MLNSVSRPQNNSRLIGMLLILLAVMVTSCTPETPLIEPTETATPSIVADQFIAPTQSPTPRPTHTPTLPPLASEGNPITIGFILTPQDTHAIEAAQEIAPLIERASDYAVESLFYPDFQSLSLAVMNGDVHLFWLSPMEYIYLNREGAAEVMLMTNHLGVYAYGMQFMANIARGFSPYFDPEINQNTGDQNAALQQFSGTRPCLISPNSIPGYYIPMGLLANASTPTLDPVFTYSYNATIRALFVQGICDFGIGYALVGDPLTTNDILQNIPEAQDQIITIWQSNGIIPNTNLSASPNIPLPIRYRLEELFLNLNNSPEGLSLISTALNYDVAALKAVDDPFYNSFRAALIPLELDFETITRNSLVP